MSKTKKTSRQDAKRAKTEADLLDQYGCGPIRFSGVNDALYERHLLFDDVIDPSAAGEHAQIQGSRTRVQRCALATVGAYRGDL